MKAGWQKLPFDEVVADESGGNLKTPKSEFLPAGDYAVVDQGKDLVAGYVDDDSRICRSLLPVVVFGDHTRCLKFIDFPFCMGADGIKVLRPKVDADVKYLFHFLRQLHLPDGGYDRHFKYLKRSEVILPPLAEQRRIAEVLDKAEALRAKRRAALAQLDSLTQSLFLDLFGDPVANPKVWRVSPLSEVGEIHTGKTPPTKLPGMFGGKIPFATPGDLDEGLISTERTLTADGSKYSKVVRAGSTLVGCIGNIGKIAKTPVSTAFNQQINAVEWGVQIDDDYGIAALGFQKQQMLSYSSSTVVPILNKSGFSKVTIPVPPLDLQREFARRITAVEKLKTAQRAALAELDALFASLQHRAFRGELWKSGST